MSGIRARLWESMSALRGVFRNPNLRRVEVAYGGAAIGKYAFALTLSVYAFHHGGATAVGVVNAVRMAAAAAVAPFAASFADKVRRERVMLTSDVTRLALAAGCAALVSAHAASLIVYALAVAVSVFGAVFRPAESSLLPTLARSPQELTAANITSSSFDSIGAFAGPAIGAFLLAFGGYTTAFALVAGTFAWSALFVVRISSPAAERAEETAGEPAESKEPHELVAGFRAIGAEPRLRLLIGLYGAQCFAAGALGVLIVATALRLLDIGNSGVGLLQAACGIGAVVGAGVALGLVARARLASDLALGLVLFGAPLALVGAVPDAYVAALSLGILGVGNSLVDISSMTLIQRAARSEVAGRVFGVLESAVVAAMAAGALVAPGLIAVVGVRGTLFAVGAVLPVLAVVCWRSLSAIDDSARVPQAQIDALRTVPFLAPLPLQTIEFLAGRVVRVELPAGATLFEAGDIGDRFYVLDRGALEILLPDGIKIETAPSFVGEIALLRDVPRTATVRAAGGAAMWALERSDFLAAVGGHTRSRAGAEELVFARVGAAPAG
ncbi:MAG: MFS transporter [Gaiellaceae bacterium]